VPSSSQRYGSATSMPCRVSTMSSTLVAGGGGTSLRVVRYELRPRLGFRPWLAFFLRARRVAFLVRFDIGMPRYRPAGDALQSAILRGMDAASVIEALRLAPHPEGGHYRETWRHDPGDGARGAGTAIYFLLAAGERSHWHRVDAAEIWHFHAGAPLLLRLTPTDLGPVEEVLLGPDLAAGQEPQRLVPHGWWQAAEPRGAWTLVSCTVSPAFELAGFELAPAGWSPGPR
jgi:predicted cupin superfamily sugar epimerase